MCGRYRLSRRKQLVEEYFDSPSSEEDWVPRYNVAPTQPVPVIGQNPKEPIRELSMMRWGLIPSWAEDASAAAKMINARSATAAGKPAFRDALRFRRCLVPAARILRVVADGESEAAVLLRSQRRGTVRVRRIVGPLEEPERQWVKSCSILTTTPNAVTSAIHDRMPVILDPDSYDLWLDPGMKDTSAASELLRPCDARLMRCYPVSTRINHVANDDEECSRPVEIANAQNRLFT